jgi:hypothetical protein
MKANLPRGEEMLNKTTRLLVVLVCLALVIPALSCAPGQSPLNKKLELKLEKAPRLNEPVKLTCIRQTAAFVKPGQEKKASDNTTNKKVVSDNISAKKAVSESNTYDPTYEKITLEVQRIDPKTRHMSDVPLQEILVGSSLNWEGHMTGEPMQFSATIKFPYEGCWSINARSTKYYFDSSMIVVQVAEDGSTFGCQKDYAPYVGSYPDTPSEQHPITVELDILKPPRLNEPFQITWGISTIRDIPEASGEVKFYHMEGTEEVSVPAEEVLIEGDITWQGSLKKDSPLHFTATVKLPKEGDWRIHAIGIDHAQLVPRNANFSLFLHTAKDKGRWGWTESHENQYKGPPPPPAAAPQGR